MNTTVLKGLLTLVLAAASAHAVAANLLQNPDFDLDPTNPANGWTATGTGLFA